MLGVDHTLARILEPASFIQSSMGLTGIRLFGGVALLTTEPRVRFSRQSVSTLEAALLVAFAAWGAAIVIGWPGIRAWGDPFLIVLRKV